MARSDDVATIVRNPDWFPYRFDWSHDAVQFIHADRMAHRAASFLRDEFLPGSAQPVPLGREEAIAASADPAPVHFIFHSAYCCSTLLARAFDIPGSAMGLKEPPILNDMAGGQLRGADRTTVAMVLDQSLRLLARPFAPGEATIIKPSNIVNAYIPAMLSMRPQARALLLYAPLGTYLPSIAKKGLLGRQWVRTLLLQLIRERRIDLGFSPEQYLELSDLQVAAIGWLAQQAHFATIAATFGVQRVATLDSETLLAFPERTMAALDQLFATGLSANAIAEIATGPAFAQNSKTFAAYGTVDRDAEKAAATAAHRDELAWVEQWALKIADANKIPMTLPAPLLG